MNPRKNRKRAIPNDVVIFVDHSMAIPKQIDMILKSQGKNHSYLAHLLGKRESEISKWMCGTHNFTLKTISKIEDKLGESLVKCPYEYSRVSSTITFSISANSNADILSRCPIIKTEVLSIDKSSVNVSITPSLIQKNEPAIIF